MKSKLDRSIPLDFRGSDTQYSTHAIHTYLAAMIPSLAGWLVRKYVPRKGSVLDPFSGGGAVLVEAILSKRDAAGGDVNKLATLVTKAKTTYIRRNDLEEGYDKLKRRISTLMEEDISVRHDRVVGYWFKDYMLKPLTCISKAVSEIRDADTRTAFAAALSATSRDVMLTYRNEIRLRRLEEPYYSRFNPDVLAIFAKRARLCIERICALPRGCRATVVDSDVRTLPFCDNEFDAIICSPPYGDERNGVPYTQFARNMLFWLGMAHLALERKALSLGFRNGLSNGIGSPPPSMTLYYHLGEICRNERACNEAIAFYADYYSALREMARVARHRVVIVIGQRILSGVRFDNAQITTELYHHLGLSVERYYVRKLPSKRLPKLRQEGGGGIDKEHVLVFRK